MAVARVAAAITVGVRLAKAARRAPAVAPVAAVPSVPISVVVPARNEASRLASCLDALAGAPGVVERLVVDDESSDATAELAMARGAEVVHGEHRPPGWAGKAWALHQGVAAARGEWIVCLDADTRADPRLPSALVARALVDRIDLLSVAGRFDCPPAALPLHAALLTTLVYRFGAPGTPMAPRRMLINGQCLAFRRDLFLTDGCFEPLRDQLVEDVALARHRASLGRTVAFLDGTDLLTVRPYESLAATWSGWSRSLALPGVEPLARQVADVATVWLSQALPLVRVVLGRGDPVDVALLALRAVALAGMSRAYSRRSVAYWSSPLADAAAAAALTWSALPRARWWRGRRHAGWPARPARTAAR
jgi:dolichol-phosphate mannosyltransferase